MTSYRLSLSNTFANCVRPKVKIKLKSGLKKTLSSDEAKVRKKIELATMGFKS